VLYLWLPLVHPSLVPLAYPYLVPLAYPYLVLNPWLPQAYPLCSCILGCLWRNLISCLFCLGPESLTHWNTTVPNFDPPCHFLALQLLRSCSEWRLRWGDASTSTSPSPSTSPSSNTSPRNATWGHRHLCCRLLVLILHFRQQLRRGEGFIGPQVLQQIQEREHKGCGGGGPRRRGAGGLGCPGDAWEGPFGALAFGGLSPHADAAGVGLSSVQYSSVLCCAVQC